MGKRFSVTMWYSVCATREVDADDEFEAIDKARDVIEGEGVIDVQKGYDWTETDSQTIKNIDYYVRFPASQAYMAMQGANHYSRMVTSDTENISGAYLIDSEFVHRCNQVFKDGRHQFNENEVASWELEPCDIKLIDYDDVDDDVVAFDVVSEMIDL